MCIRKGGLRMLSYGLRKSLRGKVPPFVRLYAPGHKPLRKGYSSAQLHSRHPTSTQGAGGPIPFREPRDAICRIFGNPMVGNPRRGYRHPGFTRRPNCPDAIPRFRLTAYRPSGHLSPEDTTTLGPFAVGCTRSRIIPNRSPRPAALH